MHADGAAALVTVDDLARDVEGEAQDGGGASHVAGASGDNPISEDERVLARVLGRRVADAARRLGSAA